jgi:hypothetical protein
VADGSKPGSVSHPLLARLPIDRQREEIFGSLARIEAELGARSQSQSQSQSLPILRVRVAGDDR